MTRIEGIFFDAAGVFYDRKETTTAFAIRRLKELGYQNRFSTKDARRKQELRVLANEGRISHETYWDKVLEMYGVQEVERRTALRKEILDQTFQVFGYPGGREAMTGLRNRGFILGLITDTAYPVEWKMSWLGQVGVAEFISIVACSSTLGMHKPEPGLYLNALQQARLEPAQAAFVGHDAGELAGARRVGMATVAVNYTSDAKADYYAQSLPDLLNIPIFQGEPLNMRRSGE